MIEEELKRVYIVNCPQCKNDHFVTFEQINLEYIMDYPVEYQGCCPENGEGLLLSAADIGAGMKFFQTDINHNKDL